MKFAVTTVTCVVNYTGKNGMAIVKIFQWIDKQINVYRVGRTTSLLGSFSQDSSRQKMPFFDKMSTMLCTLTLSLPCF